jgi:hypothetical protein
MKKKIVSIGLQFASDDVDFHDLNSKSSLLDWDIILFRPDIGEFMSPSSQFQGKPCLDETDSFELRGNCEHWKREIHQAVDAGKCVFVFLSRLQIVHADSGKRQYSGSGRNRQTTRIVEPLSNYDMLPISLSPIESRGVAIKRTSHGSELFASFWTEFSKESTYQVIFTSSDVVPILVTQSGNKTVGAIVKNLESPGRAVLLPDIDCQGENFVELNGDERSWTDYACKFAPRFVSSIIALASGLREGSELTPEPNWASQLEFKLEAELTKKTELLTVEEQFSAIQKKRGELIREIHSVGRIRALLFEKGKPLEKAIIHALRILGFSAHPFKEDTSEFDVVFESQEGRLIGEAEGKDTKSINIEKLRQLSMNIHEDLLREDVNIQAKAVLFGNAYRLTPLDQRDNPFSEKCITAARSSATALVFTPDLFAVIKHLLDHPSDTFARECRTALMNTTGRVSFPAPPTERR